MTCIPSIAEMIQKFYLGTPAVSPPSTDYEIRAFCTSAQSHCFISPTTLKPEQFGYVVNDVLTAPSPLISHRQLFPE